MKKILAPVLLAALLSGVQGCASSGGQAGALERAQYAYSAAIRWGDLDGAWMQLAPELRAQGEMNEIERNRWKQIQITSYRVLSSDATPDGGAARLIEIGVANRHTLTERQLRYQEVWRWDAASKTWFLTSGLPDLWAGQ
ncbi:hypothetical protein CO614_07080 [Lysobacteraceae bacterium NML120232]|nr:hypothetical protein CO608_11185 [Xanthomonadaceae bacterium NML08-0793]PJK11709.1 hypothetical protein CO614_07080 [Xanthomonadaceae bacterium NML120232]